ncbi:MAG: Lon-like protease [Frankiales bacterium]|jgi:PDZ domain-containing protein|nr:Lon-like protease [Frankiales bacterium]
MPDAAQRRVVTLVVAPLVAIGLGITAVALPVPYVEISPGKTCDALTHCNDDANQILTISGPKQYATSGQLRLTTVSVRGGPGSKMTLFDALRGWLDGKVAVLPRDITFPPGQSVDENNCQNVIEQDESQNTATTAALRQLKYKVPVTKQVYIAQVGASGAAQRAGLDECDFIESVDGKKPKDTADLLALLQAHKPGDTVTIGYLRKMTDGKAEPDIKSVSVTLGADPANPSHALLGIKPAETEVTHPPFKVSLYLGGVGGPSAGLMFALAIIDKLTPGALPGGRIIAGTGTIDDAGAVGPIGGIQQKVFAAKSDGATVFLTPAQDCADAARVHVKGIRLVSVDTLDGALSALAVLRGEPGTLKDCHA